MKIFIKKIIHKKIFEQELGLNLVELTVVLAITGLIAVPLTQIFRSQLRIPAKIAAEVNASRQIQKSSLILIEDAQAAQSFAPGTDPDYGTFAWVEIARPQPLPVTSRYFFKAGKVTEAGEAIEQGQVLRQLTRGEQETPPLIILDGISTYDQVVFQVEDPLWEEDSDGQWTFTEGKVTVSIAQIHETGFEKGGEEFQKLTETIVADFRPQSLRPVALPPD